MQAAVRSRQVFLLRIVGMLCLCGMVLLAWLLYPPPTQPGLMGWHQALYRADFLKQVISDTSDTALPEHIAPEGPAGPWEAIALPYTDRFSPPAFPGSDASRSRTTTWYRFMITPQVQDAQDPARTGFYLPAWKAQGRLSLYQNGVLVWCGQKNDASQGAIQAAGYPLLVQLPFSGPSVVTLRMDMADGGQGALAPAQIGSYDELRWRYRMRWALLYALPGAAAIILLAASIVLSVVCGRDLTHPCQYLSAASIFYTIYALFFLGGGRFTYMPQPWVTWGGVNALCWLITTAWLFCSAIAEVKSLWLKRLWLGGVAAGSVMTLPVLCPQAWLPIFSIGFYIYCCIVPFSMLPSLAARLWHRGALAGLAPIIFNLMLVPALIHDVALSYDRIGIDHVDVVPYLAPLILFSGLYLLYKRFADSMRTAEQAARQLQSRFESQENALRDSYERLRQVEQRDLLSAERQRLMRDMHDGLGSTLTGAIHMTNGDTPHAVLRQTLQDCLYDLKITVDSLESVDADLLVLLANLRYRLAPRFQAHGMTLEWSVKTVPPLVWLTPSAALHILRILQEVIANIIKHAGADRIRVATTVDGQAVVIFVEDNGKGFVANKQTAGGRGLHNIRWRAQAINSRAHWSALAKGTRFTLWMPIQQPDGAVTTLSPGMSISAMKRL
ncbi:sensor histidine kinase [Acetobacter sp.]|uniref:sensor histidine kinase n=1 Tax=Acetobacter sp. TaxID=440 RepID=UPI0039ECB344